MALTAIASDVMRATLTIQAMTVATCRLGWVRMCLRRKDAEWLRVTVVEEISASDRCRQHQTAICSQRADRDIAEKRNRSDQHRQKPKRVRIDGVKWIDRAVGQNRQTAKNVIASSTMAGAPVRARSDARGSRCSDYSRGQKHPRSRRPRAAAAARLPKTA
jgi:hypothetical protein